MTMLSCATSDFDCYQSLSGSSPAGDDKTLVVGGKPQYGLLLF